MSKKALTRARVDSDDRRANFLFPHFGQDFLRVELALYDRLQQLSPEDYRGALWHMYEVSNGAVYLAPAITERKLRLSVDTNGYSGVVSGDAAGIIACLFVFNSLCWEYPDNEHHHNLFYALREYACRHAEAEEILRAID